MSEGRRGRARPLLGGGRRPGAPGPGPAVRDLPPGPTRRGGPQAAASAAPLPPSEAGPPSRQALTRAGGGGAAQAGRPPAQRPPPRGRPRPEAGRRSSQGCRLPAARWGEARPPPAPKGSRLQPCFCVLDRFPGWWVEGLQQQRGNKFCRQKEGSGGASALAAAGCNGAFRPARGRPAASAEAATKGEREAQERDGPGCGDSQRRGRKSTRLEEGQQL